MRGLSSHNFTEKVWEPPRGRFWSLTASDEVWAAKLGLGRYIRVRVPGLYDVRDTSDKIVGYTKYDPMDVHGPYLQVPLRSSRGLMPRRMGATSDADTATFTTLTINVMPYTVGGERFLTWVIRPTEGPDLVHAGFIECLGDDNIDDFEHRLYVQNAKRGYF